MSTRIESIIEATGDIHRKLQESGFSEKQATTLTPGVLVTAGMEMICSEIEDLRNQQAMVAAIDAIKIIKAQSSEKPKGKNGESRTSE